MGGITPARIKQKVIRYWLSGLTRDEIAEKVGTSKGNVSSIIQEIKDNIPDIDLLRELAVEVKKNGYNLNLFASAYRQRMMLHDRGLSDDQIDELIQHVDEHCFRKGIEIPEFIDQISRVSFFSKRYGCPVEELDLLKQEKEMEIGAKEMLIFNLSEALIDKKEEFKEIESRIEAALAKEGVTQQDILDYKQKEPLFNTARQLEKELKFTQDKLMNLKVIVGIRDTSGAALYIPTVPHGMTSKDVVLACFLLARNAPHFRKTIISINKQGPSLGYTIDDLLDMQDYDKFDVVSY